jgi:hypothetical protein
MLKDEFITLISQSIGNLWEHIDSTPERARRELQSYTVLEIVSIAVSLLLLFIIFITAIIASATAASAPNNYNSRNTSPATASPPAIVQNSPAPAVIPAQAPTYYTSSPTPTPEPSATVMPTPSANIDPEKAREMGRQLRSDLASFIRSEEQKYRASEYKEGRRIAYGDVNGDGYEDAVIVYTLSLLKEEDYKLAAVLSNGDRYADWLKTDLGWQSMQIDASGEGIVPEYVSVEQGKIIIKGKSFPKNPSGDSGATIPTTFYYTISNGRLQRLH